MSSEITQKEFGNRLKQLRKAIGLSQKEMANRLNIAVSTYQHYERGERTAPISLIPALTAIGVSSEWLLNGTGEIFQQQNNPHVNDTNIVEMKHIELVKKFKDQQRAVSINEILIEIEQLDINALRDVEIYLRGLANGLKMAAKNSGGDRRHGERRQHDRPDQIPEGIDRRSGKDRRETGT